MRPVSLKITFSPSFSVELAPTVERPGLKSKRPPAEQMTAKLGDGAMSSSALAEAIGANHDSVRRTLTRRDDRFVRVGDGKWGLRAAGD